MANYFRNSYRYIWSNTSSLGQVRLHQNGTLANTVSFTIPTLMCQGSTADGFFNIAEMNTRTRIYRQDVRNGVIRPTKTQVFERVSGGTSFNARDDSTAFVVGGASGILRLRKIMPFSYVEENSKLFTSWSSAYDGFVQIAHASSSFNNKSVTFTTTPLSADDIASGKGYYYSIECVCLPDNASGLISNYQATHRGIERPVMYIPLQVSKYSAQCTESYDVANSNDIKVSTSFYCEDMSATAEGGPFLMRGQKYNTYQLFRKALLTVDTQIINNAITGLDEHYLDNGTLDPNNIQYPIIIDPLWENRLKSTQVYETILEVKNLWEVFQQIGKYLHAEPIMTFARDGTDRFVLSFRQLGKSDIRADNSRKITIFNSHALSQYFASFDSYVTNLFSPQNLCREIIVPKSSDSTYLISNDNAELNTAYNISEIVEFNIFYDGVWKDALSGQVITDGGDVVKLSSKIYEKSIFDILTSEYRVSPSKADSLYYTMGSNKIQNLSYVPPTDNQYVEEPSALKKIVRQLFGIDTSALVFNNCMFEVVYRTQDAVRLTQMRPDMESFVKNSSYEKYPHHEQYYNQLDKIPDSERFSANMWGQLVRSGNAIIQCQEYCLAGDEKHEGDLCMFGDMPYYAVEVQSEYYNDCVLQKVTYSAYWNEVSMITSQNSENRMYEVSERSMTRREVRMQEFIKLSSVPTDNNLPTRFVDNTKWKKLIKDLIFRNESPILPNYAYVKFLADSKRQHTGSFGQYIEPQYLFPSSEVDRTDANNIKPVASRSYSEAIVPLLRFPKKDGILFEFDMADNFKAGDYVDTTITGVNTNDNAYYAQQPVRYVDIMGRADLFQYRLFHKERDSITLAQMRQLPKVPLLFMNPLVNEILVNITTPQSIALDKDCREAISFNFQINLLDENIEFITFSNLFGEKNGRLKLMLFSKQLGMFDQKVNLASGNVVADDVTYDLVDGGALNQITIDIDEPVGVDLDEVKSLVWYDEDNGSKIAYLVVNVGSLPNAEKLKNRYLYPVYNG